ncbi:MAG: condensation domain-containing protein, partial [Clostridia bacterium]|nr:condensation domain-containing protein [Clostridia bacterium]
RGVENAIVSCIGRYAREHGAGYVETKFCPTSKNAPALEFLKGSGWEAVEETSGHTLYRMASDKIPDCHSSIECYYLSGYSKEKPVTENKTVSYKLHHIALAVEDIEKAKDNYLKQGFECGITVHDPIQNAYLSMCTKADHDAVELVAPVNSESPVSRILEYNGEVPYHLCYCVESFEEFLAVLNSGGIEFEVISSAKEAVLFNYDKVMFIRVQGFGLIELLERKENEAGAMELHQAKRSILQVVVNDAEKAVSFLRHMGYVQEKSIMDTSKKMRIITVFKPYAGKVELLVPTDESKEEYVFFLKNGAHPYKIYTVNEDEEKTGGATNNRWESGMGENEGLLHRNYLLALDNHSSHLLLQLPVYQADNRKTSRTEYKAPTNEAEGKLVEIWQDILKVEKIGINDNFFELGGHSLKAATLVSRISRELNADISLADVFRAPTISTLAKQLASSASRVYKQIEKIEERNYYPLSSSQKRVFFIQQMNSGDTSYNMPFAIEIRGPVNKERFTEIFRKIISRHEALRTSFGFAEGEAVQRVHKEFEFDLNYIESDENGYKNIINGLIKPFDLAKQPLLRVYLIKVAEDRHILFYDLHHIIADGVSYALIMREFMDLYQSRELPELRIQYKDYAVWHNNLLETEYVKNQEKYWMDKYSGKIEVLNMPLDFKRPVKQTFTGNKINFSVNRETVYKIRELAMKQGATLNSVLLSIYALLLNKYCRQPEIVVGSLVAGRNHGELENLIGMFVNYIPIKFNFVNEDAFSGYLDSACSLILEAYENQDYPFEKIVEGIGPKLDSGRNSLFDTVFILHNQFDTTDDINIGDLTFSSYELDKNSSTLDFKIDAYLSKTDELKGIIEYNTSLFTQDTMEDMANRFVSLLEKVSDKPEQAIGSIELFTEDEKRMLEEKRKLNLSLRSAVSLAVSAT